MKLRTIESEELRDAMTNIISGKPVDDLDRKITNWIDSHAVQDNVGCHYLFSIAINENKYLQKREVPKNYENSRENFLKVLEEKVDNCPYF